MQVHGQMRLVELDALLKERGVIRVSIRCERRQWSTVFTVKDAGSIRGVGDTLLASLEKAVSTLNRESGGQN